MLWVAPSTELIGQAVDATKELWSTHRPSPPIDVVVNAIPSRRLSNAVAGVIAFTTTQLASRRLAEIRAFGPDLLIFDEAHQAAARTCRRLVSDAYDETSTRVIGLSATPGRSIENENDTLSDIFGGTLVTPQSLAPDPVTALRRRGVLSAVELITIPLPKQWDCVRVGDTSKPSLPIDDLASNPARFWATVDAIRLIAEQGRCLVFGASIAHCKALCAGVSAAGIRAEVLSHETDKGQREESLKLFRAGGIDVILNKAILTTGFDLPELEDVVLATPVRSPIQWEQIVGRVSRGPAVGGTAVGRIWELDDHQRLHKRVLAAQRFSGDVW